MASNLEKWFNSDAVFKIGLDEFYFFFHWFFSYTIIFKQWDFFLNDQKECILITLVVFAQRPIY